eukprot:scaffold124241_cov24-Tisochrysis_lutea.AAC.1
MCEVLWLIHAPACQKVLLIAHCRSYRTQGQREMQGRRCRRRPGVGWGMQSTQYVVKNDIT